MTSKIHINLTSGIFEVEGSEQFVSTIYADFKDQVSAEFGKPKHSPLHTVTANDTDTETRPAVRSARRKVVKKATGEATNTGPYTPKLLKDFDIKGLDEYYAQFEPKNHPERILIFAKFLSNKNIVPITADHIYTCFLKADGKNMPKAYQQALLDTRGKKNGYIAYDSLTNISVPHLGEHHFNAKIKRKGEAG